jgi:hypothetical protein
MGPLPRMRSYDAGDGSHAGNQAASGTCVSLAAEQVQVRRTVEGLNRFRGALAARCRYAEAYCQLSLD